MCYLIYRGCVYNWSWSGMGASLLMCLVLGRVISLGLMLMTTYKRFGGSLALNILRRGTMKSFWLLSAVACVPVRL